MGADISVELVAGKLNRVGYEAFILALGRPKPRATAISTRPLALPAPAEGPDRHRVDRRSFQVEPRQAPRRRDGGRQQLPQERDRDAGHLHQVADALDRGWHYATLLFGETQIRTGHLLVAMLKSIELRRAPVGVSQEFAKISVDEVAVGHRSIWEGSDEGNLRPMDGSGVAAASAEGTIAAPVARAPRRSIASARTLRPRRRPAVWIDFGRDEEVRQIVDVLMRRRQNNPILTGEAASARRRSSKASRSASPRATCRRRCAASSSAFSTSASSRRALR